MRGMKTSAAVLIAIASIVGCDTKTEETKTTTTVTPAAGPSAVDKMKDAASKTADAAKDKTADLKDSAVDAKNSMVSAVGDAKDSVVAKAQEYYDKAKSYMESKNLASASDMVDKLEAIKAQLPAEWSAKVAELKQMYAKAKLSMTPTTQP